MSTTDVLLRTIPGERFTPYTLARKLNAKVLLESASFHRGREALQHPAAEAGVHDSGTRRRVHHDARRGGASGCAAAGATFSTVLRYFADQHGGAAQPPGDAGAWLSRSGRLPVVRPHPFPFPVGGIGYLSYEYAAQFDTVRLRKKADSLDLPDAYFVFGHVFVVFDHYTDSLTLVGGELPRAPHRPGRGARRDRAAHRRPGLQLHGRLAHAAGSAGVRFRRRGVVPGRRWSSCAAKSSRATCSRRCCRGRLVIETALPALEAYRNLRSTNPSPYMFYLDYGDFQLFGASPEVHVKVADGRAAMRPIGGHAAARQGPPRGRGAAGGPAVSDQKELAEHLMLVDLARNDLGRVAEAGSVEVTERNVIEHYSHVMHIVSQVECDMRDGLSGAEAVRATFPAGTVSGAPKIQAMETLDALESETRGFYAGIVGYVEPGGTLDSCISIRSAVKKGNRLVLHAGAGVVYDSVPQTEFEETQNKLRALAAAVGVRL